MYCVRKKKCFTCQKMARGCVRSCYHTNRVNHARTYTLNGGRGDPGAQATPVPTFNLIAAKIKSSVHSRRELPVLDALVGVQEYLSSPSMFVSANVPLVHCAAAKDFFTADTSATTTCVQPEVKWVSLGHGALNKPWHDVFVKKNAVLIGEFGVRDWAFSCEVGHSTTIGGCTLVPP